MMQPLTSRQNRLLKYLLQHQGYVTVKDIAHYLDVSEKTVYRDMQFVEAFLSVWNIYPDKKVGAGIMLTTDDERHLTLLEQQIVVDDGDTDALINNARRVKIASQLLSDTPHETSISKLSERYFISSASIVNDLKIIESWLHPLGLSLVRSQSGTHIEGSENQVRQAMASLINDVMHHKEPGPLNHSRLDPGSYKALITYFGEKDVSFVESLLQDMEQQLSYPLGEPYYINIFTHTLIMMHRIAQGKALIMAEESVHQQVDNRIFSIAKNMVTQIEQRVESTLPSDEVWFIYQYIISSGIVMEERADNQRLRYQFSNGESRKITRALTQIFSDLINIDLRTDKLLQEGLLIHIKPLLNRLKYQIHIRNPLLDDIKSEFIDIYEMTQQAMNEVCQRFQLKPVAEDEVGYLTIHFQAALERQIAHKRILVVCSSGVGTSHLLKNRILRAFPDWIIVGVISASNMQIVCQQEDIELIISTIHLEEQHIPVVYVSAFFNDDDIKRVTEKVIANQLHQAVPH
ncbi:MULTISPECIES: BglG family transcription antiterminator [Pectobacterium]|uniref:Transcription antiterminator n=1 Tax=Pectobacterium versatile TaxID=2488639 RepID=A0A855MP44_9GAMM|nr:MULTISPECIES: transcription antiterminator [Pectobacterium]MBA0172492.1 transcription antiterminator [Pectobacterium versatile]MBA0192152.1 transcription antiterminator [Pectobacterium carotovorum]MBA0202776.1 transcription antiterminator [Pectobacterium carotovorum]MBB1527117.1 transcription antiterminator [Pectobacterium carotovorum subsp. carotovorum]MBQ4781432.1 PRD domain-containing protein [Pectobacterium versatile]